jgi:hypothetical protein
MKPVTISKSKFKTFENLSDKDAGELVKALILKEQGQTPRIKSRAVKAVITSFEKPVKEVTQGELIPIVDELESECKGFLNWVAKQMHYSAEMRDLGTNKRKQVEYCGLYRKLRKTFSKEEIKQAIQFASNDEFWKRNFLSPMKLDKKSKSSGDKYMSIFLSQSNIVKHEKEKQIRATINEG